MDLPPEVRAALDGLLAATPRKALVEIAERQSKIYRERADHGCRQLVVQTEADAFAYAAWRLPATFGAAAVALAELSRLAPDFEPRSHLDLGAGPGTALLAAAAVLGAAERRSAIEGARVFREAGARLFDALDDAAPPPTWHAGDLTRADALDAIGPAADARFDLVTLCYVSGELDADRRGSLIDDAWARTEGCFVMVEPGTTAGYRRILDARARLLDAGAHLVGPCPHTAACPLRAPDWCHFAVRVARSRMHRQVKGADLGYEDEKLAWLAVSRKPVTAAPARLLRPSHVTKAHVEIDVCDASGAAQRRTVARRTKAAWKQAKKLRWGDAVPTEVLDAAQTDARPDPPTPHSRRG